MASSPLTGKLEFDVEIDATPEQFHHMWAHRPHHVHHTSSEKVQGCDLHEGEFGKSGVTICWKYVHDGKAKTAKQVVDYDHDGKSIVFTMLEGDLMDEYKSFVITIQTLPKEDGKGCIAHWILDYEMLHEGVGHPESLRQFFIELTADMAAHLVKEE
ncbi:MLP-like protein 28 [Hibiscus syriacus]|uniref:MLP-like protein 28 n=1 Tax=Hibiscus syriacus TaxID=106335 RepID=A0A6A2XSN1_HIBSY|nr:MLP-like protein 43 [Hibiscus syriacus]KAE8678642.1 MLP-like protein 28 [Hibiscus syriacus]